MNEKTQWEWHAYYWKRIQQHLFNCDCDDKAVAVCRCGTKICFFLRDYHSKRQGCCYSCDRWVRPNPYKFLVEQLPNDLADLVVSLIGDK